MSTFGKQRDDERISMVVDGALGVAISRRRALGLLGTAGVAAVVVSAARPLAALAAEEFTATSSLNLRAKPRSNAKVLRVIPEGGVVTKIGNGANRYLKVVYDGTRGYAHLDYLTNVDGPADPGQPNGVGQATTDVNLRSGPSATNTVLRVLKAGTEVSLTDQLNNGYRYVVHQGLAGWVWDASLGVPNGGDGGSGVAKTTTTAVNHRAEPNTTAHVYAVIPAGTTIFAMGDTTNGFEKVRYNSLTGWVYADYLR